MPCDRNTFLCFDFFYDCSTVLWGTRFFEFEWLFPKTGLQFSVKVLFYIFGPVTTPQGFVTLQYSEWVIHQNEAAALDGLMRLFNVNLGRRAIRLKTFLLGYYIQ